MRLASLALFAVAGLSAGSASAATRSFAVGGFDRVSSSVPFDVRVHTGAAPAMRADGPQPLLDRLTAEVRGGELVISATRGWSWSTGQGRVVIDVAVPALKGAALSGPGNMVVDRVRAPAFDAAVSGPGNLDLPVVETERLNAVLSGPGNLALAGRAGTARLVLSGPGDIRATRLSVRDAEVMLSGPGNLAATVTGTARGALSGPGGITIRGGARCAIRKSGPGDVHCG